jgi:hypothetical protein
MPTLSRYQIFWQAAVELGRVLTPVRIVAELVQTRIEKQENVGAAVVRVFQLTHRWLYKELGKFLWEALKVETMF